MNKKPKTDMINEEGIRVNIKTGKPVVPERGGARSGAGRPSGSGHRLSAQDLLIAIEKRVGASFESKLADAYAETIETGDKKLRFDYERLILNKVVADVVALDVTNNEEALKQKSEAFSTAIQTLFGKSEQTTQINKEEKPPICH